MLVPQAAQPLSFLLICKDDRRATWAGRCKPACTPGSLSTRRSPGLGLVLLTACPPDTASGPGSAAPGTDQRTRAHARRQRRGDAHTPIRSRWPLRPGGICKPRSPWACSSAWGLVSTSRRS